MEPQPASADGPQPMGTLPGAGLAKPRLEPPLGGLRALPRSDEYLRGRRRQILAETAARLIARQDPDTIVLPALYAALAAERIVDATLGFIVTDMGEGMKLGFIEGFPSEVVQRCLTLDFGQAICGTVALTRQPMHVTDIQRNLDPLADLVRSAGINAYACEPLIVGDRLLGTLSFASRSRSRFDIEDIFFFRALAKHVATARDQSRRRARRMSSKSLAEQKEEPRARH